MHMCLTHFCPRRQHTRQNGFLMAAFGQPRCDVSLCRVSPSHRHRSPQLPWSFSRRNFTIVLKTTGAFSSTKEALTANRLHHVHQKETFITHRSCRNGNGSKACSSIARILLEDKSLLKLEHGRLTTPAPRVRFHLL